MSEEYYVVPVVGDDSVHSDEFPFCGDMPCPCHEDNEAIGQVGGYVDDGLMTTSEADQIYRGKTI
jgi:hypothetical protein